MSRFEPKTLERQIEELAKDLLIRAGTADSIVAQLATSSMKVIQLQMEAEVERRVAQELREILKSWNFGRAFE